MLLENSSSGLLGAHAVKESNLSALNMLLMFPSEAGHREIMDVLPSVRALRARDISLSATPSLDSASEACSSLLIIAVLVATATFQVGLSPPGGTCQDSYFPNPNNGTGGSEAHIAGTSIMGTNSEDTFALFMVFNSMVFFFLVIQIRLSKSN